MTQLTLIEEKLVSNIQLDGNDYLILRFLIKKLKIFSLYYKIEE